MYSSFALMHARQRSLIEPTSVEGCLWNVIPDPEPISNNVVSYHTRRAELVRNRVKQHHVVGRCPAGMWWNVSTFNWKKLQFLIQVLDAIHIFIDGDKDVNLSSNSISKQPPTNVTGGRPERFTSVIRLLKTSPSGVSVYIKTSSNNVWGRDPITRMRSCSRSRGITLSKLSVKERCFLVRRQCKHTLNSRQADKPNWINLLDNVKMSSNGKCWKCV